MKLTKGDIERFWSFVKKGRRNECWLWQGGGNPDRYGNFSVGPRNSCKQYSAHRLSYFLHHGEPQHLVLHKCDVPRCVNPNHLYDGTQLQNRRDCMKRNRVAKGSRHGGSILSESDVVRIVDLHKKGWTVTRIVNHVATTERAARHVIKGETWSWLTGISKSRKEPV
jgi:hypothetical protein